MFPTAYDGFESFVYLMFTDPWVFIAIFIIVGVNIGFFASLLVHRHEKKKAESWANQSGGGGGPDFVSKPKKGSDPRVAILPKGREGDKRSPKSAPKSSKPNKGWPGRQAQAGDNTQSRRNAEAPVPAGWATNGLASDGAKAQDVDGEASSLDDLADEFAMSQADDDIDVIDVDVEGWEEEISPR